ncbi:MAG: hypothetical protein IK121_07220 [Lachnospiraceae bacterium]|nr:hypothetical protein [Lachnospiraceae bacterium]
MSLLLIAKKTTLNSNLVVTIIILILVTLLVLLLKFLPKPAQNPAFRSAKEVDKFNLAIEAHNKAGHMWGTISNDMNDILDKKKREIILKRDGQSSSVLANLVNEFNFIADEVNNYMTRSSTCLDARNIPGSEYCMNALSYCFNKANAIVDTVKNMTITDYTGNIPVGITPSKSTQSMSLFSGCNTKEEIDARYRSLAKAFHPDSRGGDETMFKELEKEYKEVKV